MSSVPRSPARFARTLFADGELVVSVDHPAWATELELAGSAVLSRLAEKLGDMAPKRLSVRVEPGSRR